MSIKSVMPSYHLILCCPLLLLPSVFSSIRVFPMSQLFASSGQSIGASALALVLPMSIQDWFPLGLNGLITLQSKKLSKSLLWQHSFFNAQLSLWSNSHIHTWLLEKHSFDLMDLCQQIMSLLFSMLSRLVIAFLPRSKCLLISWLLSPSAVNLEPMK